MTHRTTFDATGHARESAIPRTQVDLIADGALWAINRSVYHPRGYALAFDTVTGELLLFGDGSKPWCFADQYVNEDEKLAAHEALLSRNREPSP